MVVGGVDGVANLNIFRKNKLQNTLNCCLYTFKNSDSQHRGWHTLVVAVAPGALLLNRGAAEALVVAAQATIDVAGGAVVLPTAAQHRCLVALVVNHVLALQLRTPLLLLVNTLQLTSLPAKDSQFWVSSDS